MSGQKHSNRWIHIGMASESDVIILDDKPFGLKQICLFVIVENLAYCMVAPISASFLSIQFELGAFKLVYGYILRCCFCQELESAFHISLYMPIVAQTKLVLLDVGCLA